jgi:hypothetical protein
VRVRDVLRLLSAQPRNLLKHPSGPGQAQVRHNRAYAARSRSAPAPRMHKPPLWMTSQVPRSSAPVRPLRFTRHQHPPAEVPSVGPGRSVPRDIDRPQEPEPAQQIHPIRAQRRLGPSSRLQVAKERRHRLHRQAGRVKQQATTDRPCAPASPSTALPPSPVPAAPTHVLQTDPTSPGRPTSLIRGIRG